MQSVVESACSNMSFRSRKTVVHSEGRNIISNIVDKCDEEALKKCVTYPVNQATKRAAHYAGVSESFVKRIRRDKKILLEKGESSVLSTPGKNRNTRPEHTIVHVDNFDQGVIRRIIHSFYANEKQVPTIRKLLPVVKDKIGFPWGETSLLRVIKHMGFKWKKCQNKRKVLIENPRILEWRHDYLIKIRDLRRSGRNIIYLDETWVDNNLTFAKCWQSESEIGVQTTVHAGNRLIVVHAGSVNGFVENALLAYKAGSASGDYHGQMNGDNFEKWVRAKLTPNLPPSSVIVLDNAPYHCVQLDRVPTRSALKSSMVTWLQIKKYISKSP